MLGIHVLEPYGTRHGHRPDDWKFGDAFGSNTPAMFDKSCMYSCTYPCPPFAPLGDAMFGNLDDSDFAMPWWMWVAVGALGHWYVDKEFLSHRRIAKKAK